MSGDASFLVVIACGGTGGHLFPGLAVAEKLRDRGHEVLLIVSEKAIDGLALAEYPEFRCEKLPSIGMPSPLSPAFIKFLKRAWESLRTCLALYRRHRPAVILGMGGFTSAPPLLAGRLHGLPTLLHESNAIPGKANFLAARFVTRVLTGFEETARKFRRSDCLVTGTPVRRDLGEALPREDALTRLKLDPGRPTLLVMGGSQGAVAINQVLFRVAPHFARTPLQIIHLTGENDDRLAAANYRREGIPHYVASFHHAMAELYSAADLVISRAGAASLSELSHFRLPAILIPYPFATDDHQTANARIFSSAGAAELLPESEVTPEKLSVLISNIISDEKRRLAMSEASGTLCPHDAAANVADAVEETVRKGREKS